MLGGIAGSTIGHGRGSVAGAVVGADGFGLAEDGGAPPPRGALPARRDVIEWEDMPSLHERVRREFWGYAADEALSNEDLIAEKYSGIRPAPGYPACPDHLAKQDLFKVLAPEEIGMGLTDSMAMTPAASVSGFYLAHPDATYFNVGKVGADQAADWGRTLGIGEVDSRRRLSAVLDDAP